MLLPAYMQGLMPVTSTHAHERMCCSTWWYQQMPLAGDTAAEVDHNTAGIASTLTRSLDHAQEPLCNATTTQCTACYACKDSCLHTHLKHSANTRTCYARNIIFKSAGPFTHMQAAHSNPPPHHTSCVVMTQSGHTTKYMYVWHNSKYAARGTHLATMYSSTPCWAPPLQTLYQPPTLLCFYYPGASPAAASGITNC
jgi:hypothetical protein